MSDYKDSTVTYTAVSSPFGGLSDIGSPVVDGPPVMPEDPYAYVVAAFQAPSSPDYVSGPEYPPSPDFLSELVYLDLMPPEDEVLPAEEQPLPAAVLPTTDSPGYDDDVYIVGDEEEEEHPAPVDSIAIALPAIDHAPSAEETESFETAESADTPPPHPAYRVTARISIRDEPPTPFWSDTEVSRLLAIPTLPPSPPSPWSSPLPQIPSPLLPVSPPPPASPTYSLGYRAAMIWLRAEAPSTSYSPPPYIIISHTRADTPPSGTPPLLPIPAPTSSPSLLLPSADHGADRPEVCLPPRKRLYFAFGPRYEVGESSSAPAARPTGGCRADYGFVATINKELMRDLERDVGYGITDTWDEMLVDMPGAPATNDTEAAMIRLRVEAPFTSHSSLLHIILSYTRDDTPPSGTPPLLPIPLPTSSPSLLLPSADHGADRLEVCLPPRKRLCFAFGPRDRRARARTSLLMEREARMSREAWGRSSSEAQFIEALKLLKRLQTQMTEFDSQQGPAKGPAQPDALEEAGINS
ncbi:hypothetical protein Tco_0232286 [Tanacetum coccineum]